MSSFYTEKEFWPVFKEDLKRAQTHVILHCPFLSKARVLDLEWILKALNKRGVVVCVFLQRPDLDFMVAEEKQAYKELCKILLSCKVHFNLRTNVHSKILLIDDELLWEGSLNVLSQKDKWRLKAVYSKDEYVSSQLVDPWAKPNAEPDWAKEHMRRFVTREERAAVAQKHQLYFCVHCERNRSYISPSQFDKDCMQRIGAILKRRREELGLVRVQLGTRTKTAQQRLAEYESGARSIGFAKLFSVCDALELDVCFVPRQFSAHVFDYISEQSGNRIGSEVKRKGAL